MPYKDACVPHEKRRAVSLHFCAPAGPASTRHRASDTNAAVGWDLALDLRQRVVAALLFQALQRLRDGLRHALDAAEGVLVQLHHEQLQEGVQGSASRPSY